MKQLQITCRWDVRVVWTCPPHPPPPRTPMLCLCKHTLKIMYTMWFWVASERHRRPSNCPPSCAAVCTWCSALNVCVCVCFYHVRETERDKDRVRWAGVVQGRENSIRFSHKTYLQHCSPQRKNTEEEEECWSSRRRKDHWTGAQRPPLWLYCVTATYYHFFF